MYGIRPLENSLCQLFFRLLCVFTLYISCKLHIVCTAGREKKQRIGGRKCNGLRQYQGLRRRPAYSRIASASTRAAATIVFQFECPGCITHRTQASSSFEKSWRNTIRQDRRCQMLASSQNGHEIVSIRGRFPPSMPELRVILDLAPCKLRDVSGGTN